MSDETYKMHRFGMYCDDWIAGTMDISLEEEAAYLRICLLIYSRGGAINDNDRWLANSCRISTRKWRTLRQALIDKGKITVSDGLIHQERCEKELEKAAKRARKQAESGSKGGRTTAERYKKPNENSPPIQASATASLKPARATPLPSPFSFPKGKDGGAPSPSVNLQAVIFGDCLAYLIQNGVAENNARKMLGKWRKDYGDGNIIEIIGRASQRGVSEPIGWVEKSLKTEYGDPAETGVAPW